MYIQGEGTMQGCDLFGIDLSHVHNPILHSQVSKRCLLSSLSLCLLSYSGEVAGHLQHDLTGLSALRLKRAAGPDGGCRSCIYFTVYFCTLLCPVLPHHIQPSPTLRWMAELSHLLSRPESWLKRTLLLHDGGRRGVLLA